MEDVAEISGVAASDDHVDIEFALRNANLDGYKDALPSLRRLRTMRMTEGMRSNLMFACLVI
jgi:hypothetical protein